MFKFIIYEKRYLIYVYNLHILGEEENDIRKLF